MTDDHTVRLALRTFSYEQYFLHKPGFDAHAFLALATDFGMAGVHISLNGFNYRCPGGTEPAHRRVRSDAAVRKP
ncbi:MAG: hypothetical protein GDA49_13875 [Rhodospirillales bacterium]|nr:hypothetical protein [Rhodospirillales bacterium]